MFELDLPRSHTLPPGATTGCVVAVDAGATKTRARALRLDSGELSDGQSGGGNADSIGVERAVANISEAIREAAGTQAIVGVLLACAGADLAEVKTGLTQSFNTSGYVEVVNDVIGAWGSSFGGRDGLTLISGTGSHGVGVFGGKAVRVGGWGHAFGDEGSAYALGRSAITASLMASDGRGPASALPEMLSEHFDGLDIAEIVARLYRSENLKADTAALARVVDAAAVDGDEVATAIMVASASELARHIEALAAHLPVPEEAAVGLVGSTWKSDVLTEAFRASLVERGGVLATLRAARIEREPVDGVLALLLQSVGLADQLPALGW